MLKERIPRVHYKKMEGLITKLCPLQKMEKGKLWKVMGFDGKAAITSHIKAAISFGLIDEQGDTISLTTKGIEFCQGQKERIGILLNFLTDTKEGLGELTEAIRQTGSPLTKEQIKDCIFLFVDKEHDARSLINVLLSWYEEAGLLKVGESFIYSFLQTSNFVMQIGSLLSREALDLSLYTLLLASEFGIQQRTHPLSYEQIKSAYDLFKTNTPSSAEEDMMRFLSRVFQVLGFYVQMENGPRNQGKLEFGSQGDDFLVSFPLVFPTQIDNIGGIAFACELKRKRADKKGASQALTFSNVVQEVYPDYHVVPIVISDSERYVDDIAAKYASSSNVTHLPLEFLKIAVDLQLTQYSAGQNLITPLEIIKIIIHLNQNRIIEPRISDLKSQLTDLVKST